MNRRLLGALAALLELAAIATLAVLLINVRHPPRKLPIECKGYRGTTVCRSVSHVPVAEKFRPCDPDISKETRRECNHDLCICQMPQAPWFDACCRVPVEV